MKTDMQKMRNGELYRFDGEESSPICPPQQSHLPTINNHIMRNKFFIGLLFGLFLPLHLVSQTREDVVAINTAMWETKKISENIEVRQMRWPLAIRLCPNRYGGRNNAQTRPSVRHCGCRWRCNGGRNGAPNKGIGSHQRFLFRHT